MPRTAREQSESGVYHIMIRGIGKQNIFEYDAIELLAECKEKSKFELYAYCLMNNHVHILLKPAEEPLGIIFRRIGSKYVYWFNTRYERSGHLFQNRFRSEPVEDDSYFTAVIRYIHYNPVKGGLTKSLKYRFSSYNDYESGSGKKLTDTEQAFETLGRQGFFDFHKNAGNEQCLDITEPARHPVTEAVATELIRKYSKTGSIAEFGSLPVDKQQKAVIKAHEKGVSIRQLVRITGVSKGLIEKWLKNR
jgi:REP element-mobilizing transposase RayT